MPDAQPDPVAAFRNAYSDLYQPVANYLFRLGDRHATEDVLHDVFLAVHRALPRFRDQGVPIRHWVLGIASRNASRWLRRRQRERHALQDRGAVGPQAANPADAESHPDSPSRPLEALS